jgi:hypothetical protein
MELNGTRLLIDAWGLGPLTDTLATAANALIVSEIRIVGLLLETVRGAFML